MTSPFIFKVLILSTFGLKDNILCPNETTEIVKRRKVILVFNFIEIDGTKVGHNILIVGYTEEGNYIYIDPNYSDKEFECSPDYLNSKNASKYDFEIKKIEV